MKHLFTVLTTVIATVLISPSILAQNFAWSPSASVITFGTPLVLTANIHRTGVINIAEGKSPLVLINIQHTYTADLEISLTSPSGTTVILSSGNGGSSNDYTQTVFANTATTSITTGSAPFTGFFLPQESLTAFDGEMADGTWTLTVTDMAFGGDGTFIYGYLNFRDKCSFSYSLIDGSIWRDGSYSNDMNIPTSGVNWGKNIHNQSNNALIFTGTSHATSSSQATPTTGVTMAAWIKPMNVNSDQKVMGIADATNTIDIVSLGILNGTADFEVKEESGGGRVSMGAIYDEQWVHIAGTWSTVDNTIRLYVNGELAGTTTGPTSPLSFTYPTSTSNYPVFGAAAWNTSSFMFEGSMDDMRLYGQALSQWQIRDIVTNLNQYCETAVDLPVVGYSCNPDYYAQNYGGNGANGPATSCGGNVGGDSWFTVTVPATGNVTISSSAVTGSNADDIIIEAYSGTCDNLTYLSCNDVGGGFSELLLTNLNPGDVIFVKSWHYNNDNFGQYVVCAFDPTLSIEESENEISINLFPNPATENVTIEADLETSSDVTIILTNTLGQTISQVELENVDAIQHVLNLSDLQVGAYLVNIVGATINSTKRLIIQ